MTIEPRLAREDDESFSMRISRKGERSTAGPAVSCALRRRRASVSVEFSTRQVHGRMLSTVRANASSFRLTNPLGGIMKPFREGTLEQVAPVAAGKGGWNASGVREHLAAPIRVIVRVEM